MISDRRLHLEWVARQGRDCLKIADWTESELLDLAGQDAGRLSRRLALYTTDALDDADGHPSVPAVAGRFEVERDGDFFGPRFAFADGVSYSLLIHAPDAGCPETWTIQRPARSAAPTAQVLEIYPTAEVLPLNLLRVYVHFSDPMSEGWAARAISVIREDTGETLENVFLPPEPELWDAERRRLTMLLDPGRIKRGLVPNLEWGYPLVEGTTVSIAVDLAFRDAAGQPLKEATHRSFTVGLALRTRIDPWRWQLTPPFAGSTTPLLVNFDRPLDHGLLLHSLSIQDPNGNTTNGTAEIGPSELSWSFTPAVPWVSGEHNLVVEPRLEDVAGNTPVRVFDRDISRPEDIPGTNAPTCIPFSVTYGSQ